MQRQWNTGRLYSKHGQRIAARANDEGTRIVFVDVDRGIDGVIEYELDMGGSHSQLERVVMHHYDYGKYDMCRREEVQVVGELKALIKENGE